MHSGTKTLHDLTPGNQDIIAVVINSDDAIAALVSTGVKSAEASNAYLVVFTLAEIDGSKLLYSLQGVDQDRIIVENVDRKNPAAHILRLLKPHRPLLLGLALGPGEQERRYQVAGKLDRIVQLAQCPVYLVKSTPDWHLPDSLNAFVPFWDDGNSRFAIDTAFTINPRLNITAAIVVPEQAEPADLEMQEEAFRQQTEKWNDNPRFHRKILRGSDEQATLLNKALSYDFLLIGARKGNQLTRALFGDNRVELFNGFDGPAIIVREYQGRAGTSFAAGWRFLDNLLPTLSKEDRIEAYRTIRRGGRPSRDFYTMIALSAAIASLGLVLDSGAVIIGAMLVAPLMSAIIGMGIAIIHGDARFLEQTSTATVKGAFIAIATGFLLGLINFHGEATAEMLQRTSPTVLDLGVALVSGVAAAYAICRKNVSNSLPGVAIAVALVPPLATVGVCLSIGYFLMAWGAFKLFLCNMVAIVFASALVFASFGFRPDFNAATREHRTRVFTRMFAASGSLVVIMLVLLVIETRQEIATAGFEDEVEHELTGFFQKLKLPVHLTEWKLASTSHGGNQVDVTLESPRNLTDREKEKLHELVIQSLGHPADLNINIIPVSEKSEE
jgi:uncharacterized hydrophobic protein (TIGR00271 family)